MEWIYLVIAGLLEVGWAVGLEYTQGVTKPVPTVLTVTGMIASVFLLALAVQKLPLGTAYAVWTGIGAVGAAILGIAFFGESLSVARVGCIALIVCGILGLKFLGGDSAA